MAVSAADGGFDFYLAFSPADRATATKIHALLAETTGARVAPDLNAAAALDPVDDFAPLVRSSPVTLLIVSLATDVALFSRADVKMALQLAAASAGLRHRVIPFLVGVTYEYWEELGPAASCGPPIEATHADKLRGGAAALVELLPEGKRRASPELRPAVPPPPPPARPGAAPPPPPSTRAMPPPAGPGAAMPPPVPPPRVEARPSMANLPVALPPSMADVPGQVAAPAPRHEAAAPPRAVARPRPEVRRRAMIAAMTGAALFAAALGARAISRRGSVPARRVARPAAVRGPDVPYSVSCAPLPQSCDREEMADPHGMIFVRVCGGTLCMGSRPEDSDGRRDEQPVHPVDVAEFWIGKYEVSNAEYRRFDPKQGGADNMPASGIGWSDARRFCASQGHRLPTEAEWEYAARGTDGRKYPWGDAPPTPSRAVFSRPPGSGDFRPEPVTTHPDGQGPFGAFHQGGNVQEWVADCFAEDAYALLVQQRSTSAAALDRPGCIRHVLRGGSYESSGWAVRATHRRSDEAQVQSDRIGIRCVR